jgi:hypothetical protein
VFSHLQRMIDSNDPHYDPRYAGLSRWKRFWLKLYDRFFGIDS